MAENGDRIKDTVQAIQDHVLAVRTELEVTLTTNELEVRKNRDIITTFVAVEADMAGVRAGNEGLLQDADIILRAASRPPPGRSRSRRRRSRRAARSSRPRSHPGSRRAVPRIWRRR